jgi:hypothetical protein
MSMECDIMTIKGGGEVEEVRREACLSAVPEQWCGLNFM